jgi:hypothetical protein
MTASPGRSLPLGAAEPPPMSAIATTAPPPRGSLVRFLRLFTDVRDGEGPQLLLLTFNEPATPTPIRPHREYSTDRRQDDHEVDNTGRQSGQAATGRSSGRRATGSLRARVVIWHAIFPVWPW